MAKNLVTLNVNNADYSLRPFATCQTSATAETKVVSINDFELFDGATILVKFLNTNTHLNPTLDVNNTGAKTLICNKKLIAGNIYEFVYSGENWVHVNDTANNELVHIKYFLSDNLGRPVYILIAKLDNWVAGTNSDYRLIGTVYGARGGNQSQTMVYDIVAQAVSYAPNGINKILYTSLHKSNNTGIHPCIVSYTNENDETNNYLALKKVGSGDNIHFQGLAKDLLPQNEWIELPVAAGETLPVGMTEVATEDYTGTNYSLTTNKYFDGTEIRTLLHSANYGNYALPKAGGTITGNLTVNGATSIGGNATISGNTTIGGNATISGNTTIGDSINDTFTVTPNLTLKNNINFSSIDNSNRFISFNYSDSTPQFSWRIGYLGEGQGENNFLTFQSGGIEPNSQFTDALKFGCNTLNATFAGHILPTVAANTTNKTSTQNIGAADCQWNNIYAKTIYQNGQELINLFAPASLTDSCITEEELNAALTNRINGINYNPTDWSDTKYAAKVTQTNGVISVTYKDMLQLGTGNNNAARGDHNHDTAYTSSNTVNSMIETKIGELDYTPSDDEAKDTNYVAYISQSNGIIAPRVLPLPSNISGNAGSATKLAAAKTLTIGNSGKSFDGSNNVSWTIAEIGADVVKQEVKTTGTYPLVITDKTATGTGQVYFDTDVKLNTATNTISADISGSASKLKFIAKTDVNECYNEKNLVHFCIGASRDAENKSYAGTVNDENGNKLTHGFPTAPTASNANSILWVGTYYGDNPNPKAYGHQLGFSSDKNIYHRVITAEDFDSVSAEKGKSWKRIAYSTDISSYAAPITHTHTKSQITDFAHTHTKEQITDFAHTHTKEQITDFEHTHPQVPAEYVGVATSTQITLKKNKVIVISGANGSRKIAGFEALDSNTSATYSLYVSNGTISFSSTAPKILWANGTAPETSAVGNYEIIITGICYTDGSTTNTIYTGTWAKYE